MKKPNRHEKIEKAFEKLNNKLNDKKYDYLEEISSIINKAIKNYSDKKLWKNSYNEIVDIFYAMLTDTYLETVIVLKEVYLNISDDIPNIEDFLYKEDNKTLPERIKGYWDEAYSLLSQPSADPQVISLYLLNMYDRILTTEIQNVKMGVKEVKKPINVDLVEVIYITDGECCNHGGLYLADDDPEKPPYHPNCQCDCWSDYYDPQDEYDRMILEELGWEEEDE